MRYVKSAFAGFLFGALLVASGAAHAADPLKIRYGWIVLPASWGPLLLEKKDLMKNFGKTYVAETTHFAGSTPMITAMAMLRKAGMEPRRDYTIVEVGFPNMLAALSEKKIDLAVVAAPWSQDPKTHQMARTLFQLRDSFGVTRRSTPRRISTAIRTARST